MVKLTGKWMDLEKKSSCVRSRLGQIGYVLYVVLAIKSSISYNMYNHRGYIESKGVEVRKDGSP